MLKLQCNKRRGIWHCKDIDIWIWLVSRDSMRPIVERYTAQGATHNLVTISGTILCYQMTTNETVNAEKWYKIAVHKTTIFRQAFRKINELLKMLLLLCYMLIITDNITLYSSTSNRYRVDLHDSFCSMIVHIGDFSCEYIRQQFYIASKPHHNKHHYINNTKTSHI